MAEPRKSGGPAVVTSPSQRGRLKSMDDIIGQQARLLEGMDENSPRYARIRNIAIRYSENIKNTPESRADRERIEAIGRGSNLLGDEDYRQIGDLNRSLFGRKYPRSVYMGREELAQDRFGFDAEARRYEESRRAIVNTEMKTAPVLPVNPKTGRRYAPGTKQYKKWAKAMNDWYSKIR